MSTHGPWARLLILKVTSVISSGSAALSEKMRVVQAKKLAEAAMLRMNGARAEAAKAKERLGQGDAAAYAAPRKHGINIYPARRPLRSSTSSGPSSGRPNTAGVMYAPGLCTS